MYHEAYMSMSRSLQGPGTYEERVVAYLVGARLGSVAAFELIRGMQSGEEGNLDRRC